MNRWEIDTDRILGVLRRSVTVRRLDGIHFETEPHVVADARRAVGDVNVVSHAHADHTFRREPACVVCSTETAAIVRARTGRQLDFIESTSGIDLVPAGHVVGSRAMLFEAANGRRFCYTGDFSTRDRLYLDGFDPTVVDANVLVMETTYGRPSYRFPEQELLEQEITDWIEDHHDRPLLLFGYSLGRAQKLQHLARNATRGTSRDIIVSSTIHDVNRAIESITDLRFPGIPYDSSGEEDESSDVERQWSPVTDRDTAHPLDSLTDEIVVLPSNQSRSDWVERVVDHVDGLKAGFSGWAVDESYRYRGGYDVTFPLTDHCDFDELVATVRRIDPDVVYTHHGFATAFADHLSVEYGFQAWPLKRAQRTLGEF